MNWMGVTPPPKTDNGMRSQSATYDEMGETPRLKIILHSIITSMPRNKRLADAAAVKVKVHRKGDMSRRVDRLSVFFKTRIVSGVCWRVLSRTPGAIASLLSSAFTAENITGGTACCRSRGQLQDGDIQRLTVVFLSCCRGAQPSEAETDGHGVDGCLLGRRNNIRATGRNHAA